jgi:hypothetical protein
MEVGCRGLKSLTPQSVSDNSVRSCSVVCAANIRLGLTRRGSVFDTRIAVIVSEELEMWQKLNVTAFTMSGIASIPGILGEEYVDGSGRTYLPMIRQPVMIFSASPPAIRAAYDAGVDRDVAMAIFTSELFTTPHDDANRAAVRAVPSNELRLVGLAACGPKKQIDRMTRGLSLHA